MMKNEGGPSALIELPSRLVAIEGAFYCPENTAKSEYDFETASQRTGAEHLDELFTGQDQWWLVDWQAEVWIPGGLPVSEFRRVLFRNKAERDEALEGSRGIQLDRESTLPFAIGTDWMFPTPPPVLDVDDASTEMVRDNEDVPEWLK